MNKSRRTERRGILPRVIAALSRKEPPVAGGRRDRSQGHWSFRRRLGSLWYVAATFVLDWLNTRHSLRFVQAVPALLLVLGALAIAAQKTPSREELIDRYAKLARSSKEGNDLDAADVYYRRLTRLEKYDPAVVFERARAAEDNGELQKAKELMEQIAPPDAAGYPDAHLWLARRFVGEERTLLPRDKAEEYRNHLLRALEGDPGNTEAHGMLGTFYYENGRFEEAVNHLEIAVPDYPSLGLQLARAYALSGRQQAARQAADKSIEHYQKAIAEVPAEFGNRLGLSLSCVFLERFSEAEAVLKDALSALKDAASEANGKADRQTAETTDERADRETGGKTDEELCRESLSNLLVAWVRHDWPTENANRGELLQRLERALQHNPENPSAPLLLAQLAAGDDDTARKAKEILDRLIDDEKASAETRFVLGTNALEQGDYPLAIDHLERANELRPNSAEILNNLAWALAYQDPPDLERALLLSEEALKARPLDHEIRETRGQILAKLGRYRDAVTDLEYALGRLGKNRRVGDTHATLAEAYEKLGERDLAKMHALRSEEVAKRLAR